jgi:outer membrane protein assembly factor BamB
MDWRYPVVCLAPGGALVWQHRLPAPAITLAATPDGGVIAAASASAQRWHDYQRWYDLSAETFVRCLGPDGQARWTWNAHGPLTHQPVVGPDGIVYVGSEQRLHALRVDSAG